MKPQQVFLTFLNREAARAAGSGRTEAVDREILRVLAIGLPYTFSANISQMAEYCSDRPTLFGETMQLISSGIIDATSQSGTIDEFIESRRKRYAHVPERYPFYFAQGSKLEELKLGRRNEFDMTDRLQHHLTNFDPTSFDFGFDLNRNQVADHNRHDREAFLSGYDKLVDKLIHREDLAITKDLLESSRGSKIMGVAEVAASARVFSTLYIKIYSENRRVEGCTGIPGFPYPENLHSFPLYDYEIICRALRSLGGDYCFRLPIQSLIENYSSAAHQNFAYYLSAFLASSRAVIERSANDPNSLPSLRILLHQFIARELSLRSKSGWDTLEHFFIQAMEGLAIAGERLAERHQEFAKVWREQVPLPSIRTVGITTATNTEDAALAAALRRAGFTESRKIRAGNGIVVEYGKGLASRIIHIRTSAGSIGKNSAGGILQAAVADLKLQYLISAGICFGLKPKAEKVGEQVECDILVSTHIHDYETIRTGKKFRQRGEKTAAGTSLLQAARIVMMGREKGVAAVHDGVVLSGQKLVDDRKSVEDLRRSFPDAIGGEMEGNALATVGAEWLLVKGICDWGYDKDDKFQADAANNACGLALEIAQVVFDVV